MQCLGSVARACGCVCTVLRKRKYIDLWSSKIHEQITNRWKGLLRSKVIMPNHRHEYVPILFVYNRRLKQQGKKER